MLSCSSNIEIHATLDDVWSKMANLELYPNWSPCFAFVKNLSPQSLSFVDSNIQFHMIRFKERLKRIGVIRDFTAPHTMTFSFACPHKFWLEETWFFTLSMTEENLVRVEMMITLSGWKHVKVYQEEAYMLQAFCEAHLEGLKASLELLETNEDDDFFIET